MTGQHTRAIGSTGEPDPRDVLTQLYWAGVQAVAPGPALEQALQEIPAATRGRRVWVIAIGKASSAMALAAVQTLNAWGSEIAGGIVVSQSAERAPHPAIVCVTGDHPVPGRDSLAAASRLEDVVARVAGTDEAWVLLSGGATSLIAAPDGPVRPDELTQLFDLLLGSGLDIDAMNLIRKRFTRWGAGRLALALAPARVRNFIISDVIGDKISVIGSGPCVPDQSNAEYVHGLLTSAGLWDRLPLMIRRRLLAAETDPSLETPKPGDAAFRKVERRIIASNRMALDAIAARARALGMEPRLVSDALSGEASAAGDALATTTLSYCQTDVSSLSGRSGLPCLIWGGETTVTLGETTGGRGGRCQELMLAAARSLAAQRADGRVTLLAAGTDGRDGPTDAAGAIVDGTTWESIQRAGRDPTGDLGAHDAYAALDAAGALLRTGLTGTNVMDVVVAVCG
ncbi:MAG TPA: DUF4147 domain-containing protein [Gemmatimonadaceae bacterium]|nr:DUF4147 domain-containing protein [Gemmatimonadaceae bacterium]